MVVNNLLRGRGRGRGPGFDIDAGKGGGRATGTAQQRGQSRHSVGPGAGHGGKGAAAPPPAPGKGSWTREGGQRGGRQSQSSGVNVAAAGQAPQSADGALLAGPFTRWAMRGISARLAAKIIRPLEVPARSPTSFSSARFVAAVCTSPNIAGPVGNCLRRRSACQGRVQGLWTQRTQPRWQVSCPTSIWQPRRGHSTSAAG